MPKQMSEKTFSNLLDYYIACLEQEDLLSVTFNVSSENILFLSTLFQTEVLFHTNNKQVEIKNTEGAKKFFQTSLLRQKNKTLFYGYPVVIGPQGTISPLFFTELHYEQKEDILIITHDTNEYKLNHHILSKQNFSAEEIKNIRHEIEGDTFFTALESICKMLQFPYTECTTILDSKPFKRTIVQKLLNKAILYFGERSDITYNLITELMQLKKKPLDELASSALLLLLTGDYQPEKTNQDDKPFLEIFSLNPAQKNAIQKSLHNPLTVITGPPGTGKSQVVLNIIANAVYHNKTVLFASKNNKAVDVVIEKLNAILPYKLLVRMGHQAHRRNARAGLEHLIKQPIQKIPLQEKTFSELWTVIDQIECIQDQIFSLTSLNESLEKTQTALDFVQEQHPNALTVQEQHSHLDMIDPLILQDDLRKYFSTHSILKQLNPKRYQRKQDQCFRKHYERLPPGLQIHLQNTITNNQTTKEAALQWILTWKKEELILDEIQRIKKTLFTIPPFAELKNKQATLQKKYITLSQTLLQHHWINKFVDAQENDARHIQTYFSSSEQLESWGGDEVVFRQLHNQRVQALQKILRFLPVWVVTNLSAKQSFPLKNNIFNLLIIDEASQCDIASALPLFYRANHIVIIGDPYQLKHISLLTETQDRSLATTHHISEELYTNVSYTKHSLYDFAEQIIHQHSEQPLLLNEHYRCHPDIISFSNEYYYGRKLTIATDETKLLHHSSFHKRILWHHVKGKTIHTKSPYNEEEAERVVEEILKILEIVSSAHASIGVVTLFRAQTEMITEKLKKFQDIFETDITIGTAHRFQGDEKDIIVFSPAVSEGIKPGTLHWIQTTSQLLNVAVTRARSLFIIIGDQEICRHTTGPLRNLYDYVESISAQSFTTNSPTKQIFYNEAKQNGIPIIPNYLIKGNTPYQLDFAFFVNGNRYAIEIQSKQTKINRQQLLVDGWKIRRFSEQNIRHNLSETIEELKRLC
ncbi:MAG TPA: DEAD/DEAH box helicase [Candidatus Thermoplasmatota archaeon]|nr:DEAD/DEAH box helicase [Candidatus Thermoplasmatota archaeon]